MKIWKDNSGKTIAGMKTFNSALYNTGNVSFLFKIIIRIEGFNAPLMKLTLFANNGKINV